MEGAEVSDVIIRRFRTQSHDWGTKGHDKATCTECREPATSSVDWRGEKEWTGSYCETYLKGALDRRQKLLARPLEIDDRRLF